MPLPDLIPPPQAGRLKSPQKMPYAQVACEYLRRESAGTSGAWHDIRKVTIQIRGLKADVIAAAGAVRAVFNEQTQLVYPSGALFERWWPQEDVKLRQDEATKDGLDIWLAELEAEVWSIRLL